MIQNPIGLGFITLIKGNHFIAETVYYSEWELSFNCCSILLFVIININIYLHLSVKAINYLILNCFKIY